jgi:hypothetical protein
METGSEVETAHCRDDRASEDAIAHRGIPSMQPTMHAEEQHAGVLRLGRDDSLIPATPLSPSDAKDTHTPVAKSAPWLLGQCVPDVVPLQQAINCAKKGCAFHVLLARLCENPFNQQHHMELFHSPSLAAHSDEVGVDSNKKMQLMVQSKLVMRVCRMQGRTSRQLVSELEAEVCKAALINR